METVIKGRSFVYGLIAIWALWALSVLLKAIPIDYIETAITVFKIVFIVVYGGGRVFIFAANMDEKTPNPKAIFGKSFMAFGGCDKTDDITWLTYSVMNFMLFMPVYFVAFIIVKLLKLPLQLWNNILVWADNYLTIKRKI